METIRISKNIIGLSEKGDEATKAFELLFYKIINEDGEDYIFHPTEIINILKMLPEIRKWQISHIYLKEELFQKGIELSSQTIRNKIRNNDKFFKENNISQDEATNLLEEFVREFTERIFKEKK